ncbi:hypothetical protein BFF78_07290 [Streptomyces fodineus]|uniref:Uncharacterized protein n=1 Tax=Streptomyces fodineus TaxID=1904616 RepID=A0A1D7Y5N7_9ACTN|nr:hypothetical protein BFF78_07290 [Streptomyces fodineus]
MPEMEMEMEAALEMEPEPGARAPLRYPLRRRSLPSARTGHAAPGCGGGCGAPRWAVPSCS